MAITYRRRQSRNRGRQGADTLQRLMQSIMPMVLMGAQSTATAEREQRARDEAQIMYGKRRADTLADQVQQQANWKTQQGITADTARDAAQLLRSQAVADDQRDALRTLVEDPIAWAMLDAPTQDARIAQVQAQSGELAAPIDLSPFKPTSESRLSAAESFTRTLPRGGDEWKGFLNQGDQATEELGRLFNLGPTLEPISGYVPGYTPGEMGPEVPYPAEFVGAVTAQHPGPGFAMETDIGRALRDVVGQQQGIEGTMRSDRLAWEQAETAARAAGNFPFTASLNALNLRAAGGRAAAFPGAGSPVTLRIGTSETGGLQPRVAEPYTVATTDGQKYLLQEGWSGNLTLLGTDPASGIPYVQYAPISVGLSASVEEGIAAATGGPRGVVVKLPDSIAALNPDITISPFAANPVPGLGSIQDILDRFELEQVKNLWHTPPVRGVRRVP